MMKKLPNFLFRFLLCLSLSLLLLPAAKANAATLGQLQERFPNGAYWNHVAGNGHYYSDYTDWGSCNNPGGYTWNPCYSHSVNAPTGQYDCNSFDGGMQCCGFARRMAYEAYGSLASSWTTYWEGSAHNYMWNSLKPGDVLHYRGGNADPEHGHWVFVIAVNGNAITVGECNIHNGPCQIRWGNVIYKDQISAQRVHVAPYTLPMVRQDALDYIAKCTKYPTYGTLMVSKNGANINDRPCSKETDAGIVTLIDGVVGTKYTVTAAYKNTAGNYWYEVNTSLGQSGYIYSENCIYQPEFDDVVCNGSIPATVAMDGTLTLSGSITAPYTKIQKATVTLYRENGKEYKSIAKNAVNGAIDLSAFSFKLSESTQMKLTCKVLVNIAHYNINTEKYPTGTTRAYDIGTVSLTCVNHAFGDWTVSKNLTCTVDGELTRTCKVCGHKETKPDVAPGHNWTIANSSGVTCTNPGYTNYACLNCGEWNPVEGQVTWSDWTADYPNTSLDRIETRTQYRYRDLVSTGGASQSGYVDYVKNWPSGFYSSNSYRTAYTQTPKTAYETDTERLVIESDDVVGYLYWHWCRGRYLEQPYNSAISDGYTDTFWCFHAYYSTSYVPYNAGANAHSASNYGCCQDTYWYFQVPVYRQGYRIEAKTDTSGQWGSWSEWCDSAVSATATREVETRELYRYINSGLANHKWGMPVRTKEPTETSEGELTYTCSVCSNKMIEQLPKIQFRECSHVQTALYGKLDATCTDTGYSGDLLCTACGETVKTGTVIAALGHTEVTIPGEAATCTKAGLSDGKKCSVCSIVTKVQETVPARGHSWDDGVQTKAPTETAAGIMTYTCTICGETRTEEISPQDHAHDYTTKVVAPTCTAGGYTTYTCACGDSYQADKVAALGHKYNDNVDGTCNSCSVNRETVETRKVTHMFRMYNPNTGEHFYTGSEVEKGNLVAVGWQYEGVGFTFPTNTNTPVHRLFQPSTGEHLYTMDEAEKASLMADGWNYEGIAFNSAYDTEAVQHRLHNPNATVGAYHFTFSEEEKQNLINVGWEYQGIGWYSCWK